ncbi:putative D,D-dipeptide transport system permease protein DdpB [Meiothermus luteus]|jgi:peptide/nickel transport system permease protein|uniref:Putative D,D-dipeptide transport system permease protein DdpB n=1 Tax=Meiothermus luteus TaxID=2026184 RepID=A0A399EP27_9DEIN|nr:ABC transporter permease [Meiothermus luteus]RIH85210.1 putative D,D-dipeptide transport system permease protein DdpB [Meiothermus luteus]RMH58197.1 MAG: ABC transporter permease subunit [Deinococcota bacterium]
MAAYLVRRLFLVLFVGVGITFVTFFIAQVVPTDPAVAALGENAREEQIREFRERYGLDRPLLVQYGIYLRRLLALDLGRSLRTGRPVAEDLKEFFPATLELSLAAFLVAVALGLPAGVWAALRQNRSPDLLVRLFALLLGSTPVFFLAILLLDVLHRQLGLLPGPGRLDPYLIPPPRVTGLVTLDALLAKDLAAFRDALHHLLLPAFVLGSASAALLARMTRAAMLEVLSQDYVRTAWAKGLAERQVVLRHALKNAALPILTLLGGLLGGLLSGAVLTETIFSWPGLGRYVTQSATSLDFPAVMGVTLLVGVVYSLLNLLVDLLYALLDPRIRYA